MIYHLPSTGETWHFSGNANWAKLRRKSDGQAYSVYPIPKGNRITPKEGYQVEQVGYVSEQGHVYKDHLPYYDKDGDGSFYRPITKKEMSDAISHLRTFGYDLPFDDDEKNWDWHFGQKSQQP
jgi:hypothetical protein